MVTGVIPSDNLQEDTDEDLGGLEQYSGQGE
jgi:hypothetical protein